MEQTQLSLLVAGSLCIIAAVVGGGLKLIGAEFGPLQSASLRWVLAGIGVALIFVSIELPTIYAKGPSKRAYLEQLDSICVENSVAIRKELAKGNPFAPYPTDPDAPANRITLYMRKSAAQWRRIPVPPGDEAIIAKAQDSFDRIANAGQDIVDLVIVRSTTPRRTFEAELQRLSQEADQATRAYNAAIVSYGGTTECQFSKAFPNY